MPLLLLLSERASESSLYRIAFWKEAAEEEDEEERAKCEERSFFFQPTQKLLQRKKDNSRPVPRPPQHLHQLFLPGALRPRPVRPGHQRRRRDHNCVDVAAAVEAELDPPVVQKVELDVPAAPEQLPLPLPVRDRQGPAALDGGQPRGEPAPGDALGEGAAVDLEQGRCFFVFVIITTLSCCFLSSASSASSAQGAVEEDAAGAPVLLPGRDVEVVVAGRLEGAVERR